jgi:4-hydroxy-tetrahydrodipicolinate synthase
MKKPIKIEGIFPALATSFKPSGELDLEGVRKNIEFCLDNGCAGVTVLGSTGEAINLDKTERSAITKLAVEVCHQRGKLVIAGTGAATTKDAVSLTQDAMNDGADAALVITPFNNIPNHTGLIAHYKAVCKVGIPVILYNLPSHTGVDITFPIFQELIEIPNVIGMKESSGNMALMANMIKAYGDDVTLFTGCDNLTLQIFSMGAKAAILAIANIAPKQVVSILDSVLKNDLEGARETYYQILPIADAISEEENFPATVKAAIDLLGRSVGDPRMPITPVSDEGRVAIKEALIKSGLL